MEFLTSESAHRPSFPWHGNVVRTSVFRSLIFNFQFVYGLYLSRLSSPCGYVDNAGFGYPSSHIWGSGDSSFHDVVPGCLPRPPFYPQPGCGQKADVCRIPAGVRLQTAKKAESLVLLYYFMEPPCTACPPHRNSIVPRLMALSTERGDLSTIEEYPALWKT